MCVRACARVCVCVRARQELPARYETAVASLQSASAEAEGAALRLQLELERLAGGDHGSEPNGTSGTFFTQQRS